MPTDYDGYTVAHTAVQTLWFVLDAGCVRERTGRGACSPSPAIKEDLDWILGDRSHIILPMGSPWLNLVRQGAIMKRLWSP